MLASTLSSRIEVRLPAGDGQTSFINIIISIRDMLNCVIEYDLLSLIVLPDSATTLTLINDIQQTNIETINSNPVIQLLASGNQNTVGQVLTSVSQIFNEINQQSIETAVSSKDFEGTISSNICFPFFSKVEFLLQVFPYHH